MHSIYHVNANAHLDASSRRRAEGPSADLGAWMEPIVRPTIVAEKPYTNWRLGCGVGASVGGVGASVGGVGALRLADRAFAAAGCASALSAVHPASTAVAATAFAPLRASSSILGETAACWAAAAFAAAALRFAAAAFTAVSHPASAASGGSGAGHSTRASAVAASSEKSDANASRRSSAGCPAAFKQVSSSENQPATTEQV